jgi:hypothetical protein
MRYVKMLALAAVAVGAMMAFIGAGTASASKLCSTKVDPCPAGQSWPVNTEPLFTLLGSAALTDTAGNPIDTCTESSVKGKITNAGSSSETVTGHVSVLTFNKCTFTTTQVHLGALEIHNIAGTSNGTLTADTAGGFIPEVTINTVFFGSCVYGITKGASIGDLTHGKGQVATEGGEPAIFHANATAHRLSGSNIACPETSKWVATYQLTSQIGTTLAVTAG